MEQLVANLSAVDLTHDSPQDMPEIMSGYVSALSTAEQYHGLNTKHTYITIPHIQLKTQFQEFKER